MDNRQACYCDEFNVLGGLTRKEFYFDFVGYSSCFSDVTWAVVSGRVSSVDGWVG